MWQIELKRLPAVHVWKMKEKKKHPNVQKPKKKSWGGKMNGYVNDGEKNQFLAQCAERHRFLGLPQTALDRSKIQYNKDVGHTILESYSRVMESLAFNVIARIDDVVYVDDATKRCAAAESMSIFNRGGGFNGRCPQVPPRFNTHLMLLHLQAQHSVHHRPYQIAQEDQLLHSTRAQECQTISSTNRSC